MFYSSCLPLTGVLNSKIFGTPLESTLQISFEDH